jgi:hypothetical protein
MSEKEECEVSPEEIFSSLSPKAQEYVIDMMTSCNIPIYKHRWHLNKNADLRQSVFRHYIAKHSAQAPLSMVVAYADALANCADFFAEAALAVHAVAESRK